MGAPRHSGPAHLLAACTADLLTRRLEEARAAGAGTLLGITTPLQHQLALLFLVLALPPPSRIRKSSSMASMLSREDFMAYICGEWRVSAGSRSRDATLTLTKTPCVRQGPEANPAGRVQAEVAIAPLGRAGICHHTHLLSPNPKLLPTGHTLDT